MAVPVHTPAAEPLETSNSEVKMKPQRSDSYQPSDRADHSNRCTRTGEGSMPFGLAFRMTDKVAAMSWD